MALGLSLGVSLGAAATPRTAHDDFAASQRLSFQVDEGLNINSFLRDGPVAAHLVLRSGADPRILVAFPAGNSGIGLWFSHGTQAVVWKLERAPRPVTLQDARGRPLYGVIADVSTTGATALSIKQAVLSSVRVLRNYQADGTLPSDIIVGPEKSDSTLTWARDRLDGAAGYRLSIRVTRGTLRGDEVMAADGGVIELAVTAATGETPLTPLSGAFLLNSSAAPDLATRDVLTFLSYRETFLAGSWRFDTYFGRDTLMSVRLLMSVLTPNAVQAGLGAVLSRLSPEGEVAHEENIGEFAVLEHRQAGITSATPIFDYKMIDGTFMLAPVAAAWLLEDDRGRSQAKEFLSRPDGGYVAAHRSMGTDLVSNLKYVLKAATPFATDPRATNLIALKPGVSVGQWRDSTDGVGGGRLAYDVNAVFVPAALEAAARFLGSGLLDPYLGEGDAALFARAERMARVWTAKAAPLFDVAVPNVAARQAIAEYAAALKIPADAALNSVGKAAVRFHALALNADATAVPVLHTDEGFELLFGRPSAATLGNALTALMRPFPAGLLTPVGVVVANPVYSAPDIQAKFTRSAYHGTVIWSWQQAVLAAGMERQLRRHDLPPSLRTRLRRAQAQLWSAIRAARAVRNSELWSWSVAAGEYQVAPFGTHTADADESNAAQLWSTVFLSVRAPESRTVHPANDVAN